MPDCSVVSDAKIAINALIPHLKPLKSSDWLTYLNKERKKHPLSYKIHGGLKAQQVIDELWLQTNGDALYNRCWPASDVGRSILSKQS